MMAAENTLSDALPWPGVPDRRLGRRLTFLSVPADADLRWYVIRAATNRQKDAETSLIETGFVVYMPRLVRWRRHAGRKHKIERPLLGDYLFVGVSAEDPQHDKDLDHVRGCFGVHGFVRSRPDRPPSEAPFRGQMSISSILAQELAGQFDRTGKSRKDPKPGDQVKVIRGMFQGFPARFVERTEDDRVKAFLTMFGKETLKVFKPEDLEGLDPEG